jgi:hypothetical protein
LLVAAVSTSPGPNKGFLTNSSSSSVLNSLMNITAHQQMQQQQQHSVLLAPATGDAICSQGEGVAWAHYCRDAP